MPLSQRKTSRRLSLHLLGKAIEKTQAKLNSIEAQNWDEIKNK